MVSSSTNVLPSSLIAVGWIPALSVLLAVAGVVVIVIGTSDTATTLVPPLSASAETASEEGRGFTGAGRERDEVALMPHALGVIDSQVLRHRIRPQAAIGEWHGPDLAIQWRPRVVPSDLAVQLARGTRAESAQLATIALEHVSPDARRYLMDMAGAQRGGWRRSQ
jgi:hypothetical protein